MFDTGGDRRRGADVLTAAVTGIQDAVFLNRIYRDLDDYFPQQEEASAVFRRAMEFVSSAIDVGVRTTRFRNQAWFYSLAVAATDSISGIPSGIGPRDPLPGTEIETRMQFLEQALQPEEVAEPLGGLKAALLRSTGHVPERRRRHHFFFRMLTEPGRGWLNNLEHLPA